MAVAVCSRTRSIDTKSRFWKVVLMFSTCGAKFLTPCTQCSWRWSQFRIQFLIHASTVAFFSTKIETTAEEGHNADSKASPPFPNYLLSAGPTIQTSCLGKCCSVSPIVLSKISSLCFRSNVTCFLILEAMTMNSNGSQFQIFLHLQVKSHCWARHICLFNIRATEARFGLHYWGPD